MPAALAGKLGALTVDERLNDRQAVESAARDLESELNSGHWMISSAVYDSLSRKIGTIRPSTDSAARPGLALANGVYSLWESWTRDSTFLASSRLIVSTPYGPVLLVWQTSRTGVAGFAARPEYLESQWLSELKPKLNERHFTIALIDTQRNVFVGSLPSNGMPVTTRPAGEFPWSIQAFSSGDGSAFHYSRTPFVAGMAVLAVLILTGSWFIGHAVTRELDVARLQSDFVSAVSHEFRTPLTTLCQLSELLKRGRVASESDRLQYYELLHHESQRLRRLVESLLNFGRLESGTLQYRFEKLDAAALVRQCTDEFGHEGRARRYRFEVETAKESAIVRVDRETMQCVFWNLLENAVKYSPDCDRVWVELTRNYGTVEIAVRDQGVGIPRDEQQRVFDKFVRGTAARSSDVRGTGIGLAMARQIVRAHGGDITLQSEPGKGSTFCVVLPVMREEGGVAT
jgi:signal transduction histidine kinase